MGHKDFLQSEEWRRFQAAVGRVTFLVGGNIIIEHILPIVGKYFYIPRGEIASNVTEIINLAKKEKAGWVRIDVRDERILKIIAEVKPRLRSRGFTSIKKAPHDMQPREVFVIDITKNEEQLLSEMKSKTRYNIKLAEKKGVKITSETTSESSALGSKYFDAFLRLVRITAKRDGITPHPEEYYRKMLAVIPEENLKLYVAEYNGKIIAANLVVFYPVKYSQKEFGEIGFNRVNGGTATYLHGASDNENRNVMAPYLLQWRQIQDAKKAGCTKYDFGGVKSSGPTPLDRNDQKGSDRYGSWAGITRFKTSFSPNTQPLEFPGSYDIILNSKKYYLYRAIQYLKNLL